jgi:hypothetical protein
LVLLLVLLGFWLYHIGKGFDLLVDNKTITIGDVTYRATSTVRVSIDGSEPLVLTKRGRDVISVVGYVHVIRVEELDMDDEVIRTVEKSFTLDRHSGDLLSLPALLGGEENWIVLREP